MEDHQKFPVWKVDVVEAEPFVDGKKGTRRGTDDDW
jgi:hypothetical protein